MYWQPKGIGQPSQYWSTHMPPPQAGEISMYMHSGERQQPLPYQVPAISSGESSLASFLLGRSCPWLMGAALQWELE